MDEKCEIFTHEVELINKISKLDGYESADIWSRWHNNLEDLWGRNYKDKIKIETLMSIPIEYYGEEYKSNFRFNITPKKAEEIIKTFQKILKNRKKIK